MSGFKEEDQEALYTLAQDKKSQSRQGLGRSTAPKKVAGVHWKGNKTKFDGEGSSGDEGEGGESEEEAEASGR